MQSKHFYPHPLDEADDCIRGPVVRVGMRQACS